MNRLSSATDSLSARDSSETNCEPGKAILRICNDRPDWSRYAWSNPRRVIYGPVSSRRLGRSLGVNLFPAGKVCSFECAYCDLDVAKGNHNTSGVFPRSLLEQTIASELSQYGHTGSSSRPDSITFAGNGEPTLHAGFLQVAELVERLRDEFVAGIPMHLFTNGLHLASPDALRGLRMFRRVFLKLDGASASTIQRLNGPRASEGLRATVETACDVRNIAASTILLTGEIENVRDVASPSYTTLIRKLNPREIFLYTLDYPTANAKLKPVCLDVLMDVAERLARNVPCPVIGLWRVHRHPEMHGRSYNG